MPIRLYIIRIINFVVVVVVFCIIYDTSIVIHIVVMTFCVKCL